MYQGIEKRRHALILMRGPLEEKYRSDPAADDFARTPALYRLSAKAPEAKPPRTFAATKRLLQELEKRYSDLASRAEKLEQANVDLEAFNQSVCHELRSPLAAISGFSEVLQVISHHRFDEKSARYLQGIHEGTLRMRLLIASLLDFSRVSRIGLHREDFDLSAMARAVAWELKRTHPENRVTFLIPEGITVNGDAGLCRIILDNLIGNAWHHGRGQGDMVIDFGMTELAGKPVYFVGDNGPGFDMADAGKLFIPFQGIPGITAQGHGIGLATVKRIVLRHGGRVWAQSATGEGATFFFTLE